MGLTGRPLSLAVSTVATTGSFSVSQWISSSNLTRHDVGFVLFGYDQGVMSGIITAPAFNDLFPATKGNSTMQGFVTAIYEIGMTSAPQIHSPPVDHGMSLEKRLREAKTQSRLSLRRHLHPYIRRFPWKATCNDAWRSYDDLGRRDPSHFPSWSKGISAVYRRTYDHWGW